MNKPTPDIYDDSILQHVLDPVERERLLAINRQQREQAEALERAAKFSPDARAGKVSKKTLHIRDLVAANPEASPGEIRKLSAAIDKKMLSKTSDGTLENQVYAARKFHGIA